VAITTPSSSQMTATSTPLGGGGGGGSLNLGVEVWSLPSNSHKSRSNNQLTTKYRIKTSEFLIVRFTSVGFRRRARMSGVPS
jgi:hypothetical protein